MGDFNYMDYLKNNPLLKKNADFSLIKESQEGTSSKMKKSELKAKIKENILSTLNEEDEDYERASREVEYGDSYSELENELLADLEESLNEAKDEDEEDVDVEDEDIEDEVGGGDAEALDPEAGLSQDEQDIQNALKVAYDNAVELGDEKLSKQIGNTITMFTRTRVVGDLQ